jgi:predicted metal-dependent peptidase
MKHVHDARQRAEGKIKITATRLAGRYPFHTKVLEQFKITAMPGVGTMGVTIRGGELLLLHNPDFVLATPARELGGVLLHEVHHVVLGHVTANPKEFDDRWARTIAEEVTVNEFVKEPLPEGGITLDLFPQLPPLESTAQRYERLKRVQKRLPISSPSVTIVVAGGGVGAGPSADGGQPADDDQPEVDQGRHSEKTGRTGKGTPPPKSGQLIDNHDVWQDALLDPQAAQDVIRDALVQAMLEAGTEGLAKALKKALAGANLGVGIGTEPGAEQYRLLGDRDGHLDWRHVLRRYVGETLGSQHAMTRPPRRYPELVGIVPGRERRPHRPQIMAVIDTSGSISDEMLEMIDGELRRLAQDHEVIVVECDVVIQKVAKYRRLEVVNGRGGTDFRPPLEGPFLQRYRPDVVVYFTDGYGPAPENAPSVPVIWCLVPEGIEPVRWGRAIRMNR